MRLIQQICFLILTSSLVIACRQQPIPQLEIIGIEEFSWEAKKPCIFRFPTEEGIQEIPATIKYRGGFSSQFEKHSFSLELDEKQALAGLPRDDDWILNANYIDKTFMRHKINYDLFRQMSLENKSPLSTYVKLQINEQYQGLYVLMEEVNGGMLHLDKTDSLAMLFKDPPIFIPDSLWMWKDSSNYFRQKYPKIHTIDHTAYMAEFKALIFDSSDAVFLTEIGEWIAIDNLIDWHILLLLSNNGDGILKNFYLYKTDQFSPFKIAIWDYDHSFGRDGDNEIQSSDEIIQWERCVLLERLVNIPNSPYKAQLKERWETLKELGVITPKHLKQMIDENYRLIKPELERNAEKWPLNSSWYYDDNDFQEELEWLKLFIDEHFLVVDRYIKSL